MTDDEHEEAMHKKGLYHERIEERFQRPRVHDNLGLRGVVLAIAIIERLSHSVTRVRARAKARP